MAPIQSHSDALLSSTARKITARKRADLSVARHYYLGEVYWVVKEPVGLNYFRFKEEEFAILQMLDGDTSLDEIKEEFEARFAPQKITVDELHRFVGQLHKGGLIVSDLSGQSRELLKRRNERVRKKLLAALSNILCIRFKGIDPERALGWLERKTRWVFHPLTFLAIMVLGLFALGLVLVEFDIFRQKLPEFHTFFTLKNAFWLSITLGCTKILHEFGHGVSCKHYGGECHQMGVMILVLTPCLFCNVSDSWMLPNKWHRIAIGAAGMYVELVLASICTFIWWYTAPGLLNKLCLDVMFISSVTTLMFNANPLLRYDGYYILADMLEIPNLRQKSTQMLSRKAAEWFLGMEQDEDPFLPKKNQVFFALYAVASAVYLWVIYLSILLFLYKFWKPYKLEIIGTILGLLSLYGLLIMPLWKVGKFFWVPGRLEKVKKPRFYSTLGGLVALVAAILLIPLPHHVMCVVEVLPRDAASVYVEVPGVFTALDVKAGQVVAKDQSLARLENKDLELEIQKLRSEHDQYKSQLETANRTRFLDSKAGDNIRQLEKSLEMVEKELAEKQIDQQRLHLVAPEAGTVLPPTIVTRHEDPEFQLLTWRGTPFDVQNLGTTFQQGDLFCQIGDPKKLEAILVIDQTDFYFLDVGQSADVNLDSFPGRTFSGHISELANADLKVLDKRLAGKAGGAVPTKADQTTGQEKPQETSYQGRVPIDDPEGILRIGMRGQAKIYATPETLGTRLWRMLTHMFHFRI